MRETLHAWDGGPLPGSDRRSCRVRARYSRKGITAVMRKQLRAQFGRRYPFCWWSQPAADSNSAAGYPAVKAVLQRGVATSDRDELTSTG